MDEQTARREIVNIGRLLYERSYVVSSDGNVSVRLDDGRIVATPTMICKGRMTEDSLAVTDAAGRALGKRRPSSELAMHLLIYEERPDVMAVCHAHPPHGTAFAVAGLAIDQPILSEVILTLGCVPLTGYGTPSTEELPDSLVPFIPITTHCCLPITERSRTGRTLKRPLRAWKRSSISPRFR